MPKTPREMQPRRALFVILFVPLATLIGTEYTTLRAQEAAVSRMPSERATAVTAEYSPSDQVSAETEEGRVTGAPAGPLTKADLIANLTIFVLAIFVGFEVITKVPPILHTPLMSGSNAISGITLVGAIVVAGAATWGLAPITGFIAVVLATINVVGGFAVTHRMLVMFKRK